MKTTIKLLLIYLAIQFGVGILAAISGGLYSLVSTGDMNNSNPITIAVLATIISSVLFLVYLFKSNYVSFNKTTWSPVSLKYMLLSVLLTGSMVFLVDALLSQLAWLPNIMEQQFQDMMNSWYGIFTIVIVAPVFEEIFFRGAILKALLNRFSPGKAIFISALIFGIIHFNPVQIIGAGLTGVVLGWMYYKTKSLVPVILVHIINNGLSVYLSREYPSVMYLHEFMDTITYLILLIVALVVGIGCYLLMNRITNNRKEIIINN